MTKCLKCDRTNINDNNFCEEHFKHLSINILIASSDVVSGFKDLLNNSDKMIKFISKLINKTKIDDIVFHRKMINNFVHLMSTKLRKIMKRINDRKSVNK